MHNCKEQVNLYIGPFCVSLHFSYIIGKCEQAFTLVLDSVYVMDRLDIINDNDLHRVSVARGGHARHT